MLVGHPNRQLCIRALRERVHVLRCTDIWPLLRVTALKALLALHHACIIAVDQLGKHRTSNKSVPGVFEAGVKLCRGESLNGCSIHFE